MVLFDCYNQKHSAALNKISGSLVEGREFIHAFDIKKTILENSKIAYNDRWYGNVSEQRSRELTRHFSKRYIINSSNFLSLKNYLVTIGRDNFPWINHFYMLLNDIYYRWATSEYMAARFKSGLLEISRSRFDQELKKRLPESVGDGSLARYGRNILTAIRDNGLLDGKVKKIMVSPAISLNTLAFIIYSLYDLGVGSDNFDDSPLFFSLLKSKELLIPILIEGERQGYWEFIGDRDKLRFNLRQPNLETWMKGVYL